MRGLVRQQGRGYVGYQVWMLKHILPHTPAKRLAKSAPERRESGREQWPGRPGPGRPTPPQLPDGLAAGLRLRLRQATAEPC